MNYEQKALEYAEKFGIIDYTVNGSTMIYTTQYYYGEGRYQAIVNLDTMKETRTLIK